MKTSRKRRVLLRTAATSIPCHLLKPWLCRLRALPRPQAPSPSQARTKTNKQWSTNPDVSGIRKQESNCAAGGEVFLSVRVWCSGRRHRRGSAPWRLQASSPGSQQQVHDTRRNWTRCPLRKSTHATICSTKDKYNQHKLCFHRLGLGHQRSLST